MNNVKWGPVTGGVLMVLGSLMPWVQAGVVSVAGTSGDDVLTLIGGVLIAVIGLVFVPDNHHPVRRSGGLSGALAKRAASWAEADSAVQPPNVVMAPSADGAECLICLACGGYSAVDTW